eukprot:9619746-Ditylum_brightwellii.AAC.1
MDGQEVVSLSYPVVLAKDDLLQNYCPLGVVEGCMEDTWCNNASSEVMEWLNQTLLVSEEEGKITSRRDTHC